MHMGLPEIEGSAPQTEAQHEQKYKLRGFWNSREFRAGDPQLYLGQVGNRELEKDIQNI